MQLRQRFARPQDRLHSEIAHLEVASLFSLDRDKFVANFRSSRRGTAGGHSGVTDEHLRFLFDNPRELYLFFPRRSFVGERPSARKCCICFEEGEDDRFVEVGRWGWRHYSWRCCSTFGRKNDFTTKAVESAAAPFQCALSTE